MKKNFPITTVIVVLLLVCGLGLLLYPTISNLYARHQYERAISQYMTDSQKKEKDYSDLWEAAEAYNQYLPTKEHQFEVDDEERDWVATLLNPLGNTMMGYIEIPKIDVKLPIYQGTEDKQLQSGVGWWIGTSLPTGGETTHCIITAHTGLVKAKLFTDIDRLAIGDCFTLTVLDRVLTYEVDQILVTLPDDYSELYIQDGMDYVTLYTCTPYGVNTHRLLVRGVRVTDADSAGELSAVDPDPVQTDENPGHSRWKAVLIILAIILSSLVLLLIVLLFYRRVHDKVLHRRRPKKQLFPSRRRR